MKYDKSKPYIKCFSVAFLYIYIVYLFLGCNEDSVKETDANDACVEIGEQEECICDSGIKGVKVCYPAGNYSECICKTPKAGASCIEPGNEYSCLCDDGKQGRIYCLKDSIYSECYCDTVSIGPTVIGGSGGNEIDNNNDDKDSCPEDYSCVEVIPETKICIKAAGPASCNTSGDCEVEGLTRAFCGDPGVNMGKICLQNCN